MEETNDKKITLEEIITKVPLYKEYIFKIIKEERFLKINDEGAAFFNALFNTSKCDLLCVECKKEYSFDVLNEICSLTENGNPKYYSSENFRIGYTGGVMSSTNLGFGDLVDSDFSDIYNCRGIIEQYLYCNKYPHNHIYIIYYRFIVSNQYISIMKIGQDVPSFMLTENLSNIYKKELDAYKAFDDFRMYEQSMSRGLKAGACTYLRRVLEKIVVSKYIRKNGENDTKHFEDKIKDVIDDFDEDIRPILNSTYGLLSKGIHELDDDDIDNFIKSTFDVITIQLDYEKMMREKRERRKKLTSSININAAKYKN